MLSQPTLRHYVPSRVEAQKFYEECRAEGREVSIGGYPSQDGRNWMHFVTYGPKPK
jgi:hypothetical protein